MIVLEGFARDMSDLLRYEIIKRDAVDLNIKRFQFTGNLFNDFLLVSEFCEQQRYTSNQFIVNNMLYHALQFYSSFYRRNTIREMASMALGGLKTEYVFCPVVVDNEIMEIYQDYSVVDAFRKTDKQIVQEILKHVSLQKS